MTSQQKHSDWDTLRQCWLDLDSLGGPQSQSWGRDEARAERDKRGVAHRATLDALMQAGEIDVAVADQMQVAFEETAFHVWRSSVPATCYRTMPTTKITTREHLVRQLDLLRQVAGDIDPAVVEQARAAITRDLASFKAPAAEEAKDAAHVLVSLLLGETE